MQNPAGREKDVSFAKHGEPLLLAFKPDYATSWLAPFSLLIEDV